jgi:quinol monooxygenase YgiN
MKPHAGPMIYELNRVVIDPASAADFEAAFANAAALLRTARGCRGASLLRCIEEAGRYQIGVTWETLADHREHYPAGDVAPRVRALVLPFIRSAEMLHYETALPDG